MSTGDTTTPWKKIIGLVGSLVGLFLFVFVVLHGCATSPLTSLAPDKTVSYEVSSSGSGTANNVTYEVDNGMQQETQVALPWSKEFTISGGFKPLVVTAQNSGAGFINCRILVNGNVVSENSSRGQYAVVMCSGH
jgi:hypothetical protein